MLNTPVQMFEHLFVYSQISAKMHIEANFCPRVKIWAKIRLDG